MTDVSSSKSRLVWDLFWGPVLVCASRLEVDVAQTTRSDVEQVATTKATLGPSKRRAEKQTRLPVRLHPSCGLDLQRVQPGGVDI